MLSRLPAPAIRLAREARTAVLRYLSPIERVWRAIRGRVPLPPLWLRRHAGPLAAFESSARDCRGQLEAWGALPSGGAILDLGCGPGAMALALRSALAGSARYVGIDVHEPSLAWCRRAFAEDRRFRFEIAPVASPYGRGTLAAGGYRLPLSNDAVDLVIAKSLFTHLTVAEARRYLEEIHRVLAPNGAAFVTAFLFAGALPPAFLFGDAEFRWRWKNRPAAAVAFAEETFRAMVDDAGLWIEKTLYGFLPGRSPRPTGQDVLLLRKKWRPSGSLP